MLKTGTYILQFHVPLSHAVRGLVVVLPHPPRAGEVHILLAILVEVGGEYIFRSNSRRLTANAGLLMGLVWDVAAAR